MLTRLSAGYEVQSEGLGHRKGDFYWKWGGGSLDGKQSVLSLVNTAEMNHGLNPGFREHPKSPRTTQKFPPC